MSQSLRIERPQSDHHFQKFPQTRSVGQDSLPLFEKKRNGEKLVGSDVYRWQRLALGNINRLLRKPQMQKG